jgi:hypothetical protein
MLEPVFMKLAMYIMAPEHISTAYFINPSHDSLSACVPLLFARQQLGKHVPAARNTRNNRIIVGRVSLWVCLCIPLSLLGNNQVKTFPWQRRIVGVVFYAALVVGD